MADVATARKRIELQAGPAPEAGRQAPGPGQGGPRPGQRGPGPRGARPPGRPRRAARPTSRPSTTRSAEQEEKLVATSQRLQAQVEQFRTKKETLKASYTAAEAQTKVGEAVSGISTSMGDAGAAMQRAQDKIAGMQARAGAIDELLASGALTDLDAPGRRHPGPAGQGVGHLPGRQRAGRAEGRARPGPPAAEPAEPRARPTPRPWPPDGPAAAATGRPPAAAADGARRGGRGAPADGAIARNIAVRPGAHRPDVRDRPAPRHPLRRVHRHPLGLRSNWSSSCCHRGGLLFAQYWFSDKIALWGMHGHEVTPEQAPELHGVVDRLCALADMPKPRVAIADTDMPERLRHRAQPEGRGGLRHHRAAAAARRARDGGGAGPRALPRRPPRRGRHDHRQLPRHDGRADDPGDVLRRAVRGRRRRRQPTTRAAQLAAMEAIIMLVSIVVYAISFLLTRALSRYRELAADRSGAILIGRPSVLASALVKITGEMCADPDPRPALGRALQRLLLHPGHRPGTAAGRASRAPFSTHPTWSGAWRSWPSSRPSSASPADGRAVAAGDGWWASSTPSSGRTKPVGANLDALFALPSAAVTLETAAGLVPSGPRRGLLEAAGRPGGRGRPAGDRRAPRSPDDDRRRPAAAPAAGRPGTGRTARPRTPTATAGCCSRTPTSRTWSPGSTWSTPR